jgi:hypothetical protein
MAMGTIRHERVYSAGSARIPMQIDQRYYGREADGRFQDTDADVQLWFQSIMDTLNHLPPEHVALLAASPEGNIRVWGRPGSGGGAEPVGGIAPAPHIWLNYDCFRAGRGAVAEINSSLLHEMGHQVDFWQRNRGVGRPRNCMYQVAVQNPAGCAAMLTRRHGSSTRTPNEHFAYVYADYFNFVRRGRPTTGLAGEVNRDGCTVEACASLFRRCGGQAGLPASNRDVVALRYAALLQTEPFVSIGMGTAPAPSGQPASGSPGASGVAPHSSSHVPREGPRGQTGPLGLRQRPA